MKTLKNLTPGYWFALASLALLALTVVVVGGKLSGEAAGMIAAAIVGALSGVPVAVAALILFGGEGLDVAPPDEVVEAIEDLRLYVTSASLLSEVDEDTEEALMTVWAWLDTIRDMKGERQ